MNTEHKIKCSECGISVPDVLEGSGYEATLCNSCYDKTEQKHTPGSWQIANGAQLRVIPGHRRANAALIAAAPEMLAALRGVIPFCGGDTALQAHTDPETGLIISREVAVSQARAAIRNATEAGEEVAGT